MNLRRLTLQLPLLLAPVRSQATRAGSAMRLASLEWRPYVSSQLVGEGFTSTVVSDACKAFDTPLQIDYFPWLRAIEIGTTDTGYAGYFPAYYTAQRALRCDFSAPIGSSVLGLAFLKSSNFDWGRKSDLYRLRIGVVLGYSNGAEFDALVQRKQLHVETSTSDRSNLKKLQAGRIDVIAIDRLVLRYLLLSEPQSFPMREQVSFHPKLLAELPMYICFQRSPAAESLRRAFNRAMQHVDPVEIERAYFVQLEKSMQH